MRAALFDRYGPPEVLYAGTRPIPVVGPDRLLVRVHAVTVNGGELILRSGQLPRWLMRGRFPRQIGLDFVGEVAELGDGTHGYAVGDRVWGALDEQPDENGQALRSLADYVAVAPTHLSPAPARLASIEAVTLLGGIPALIALRRKAGLQPTERLLVRGAAGGVGSIAVQLGTALGAHVTGLGSARTLEFVSGIGADETYDYRSTPLEQLGPFDVVLDTVGTQMPRLRRRLAPGGRMVATSFDMTHIGRSLATITASAMHGRGRIRFFRGSPEYGLLAELARMADDGVLQPVVEETYPLSQVAEAHRRLADGGVHGKVVISLA